MMKVAQALDWCARFAVTDVTEQLYIMAPFACLKFSLFGLFFQPEQCFSLTTIQPEQYFSASFSQVSDQRTGPLEGKNLGKLMIMLSE